MPRRETLILIGILAGILAFVAFLVLSFWPAHKPAPGESAVDTRSCLDDDPSLTAYSVVADEPFVSTLSQVQGQVTGIGLESGDDRAAVWFFESEEAAADAERRLRGGTDRQIMREGFAVLALGRDHAGGPAPYARCIWAVEQNRWDYLHLHEILFGSPKYTRPFL